MCLTKVTEFYDDPPELIVDGWKFFSGPPTAPRSRMQPSNPVPLDAWIEASAAAAPTGIQADDGKVYMPGFHVYADEREAGQAGGYRRVYVRRVTASGTQDGRRCLIAQEMYVPSSQGAWPPLEPPPAPTRKPAKKSARKAKGGS